MMRTALESAHKGWGESIIIGVAPQVQKFQLDLFSWLLVAFGKVQLSGRTRSDGCSKNCRLVHGRKNSNRPYDHA